MNDKDKLALVAALLLPGVQRSDHKARAEMAVEQASHLLTAVEDHFAKVAGELAVAQQKAPTKNSERNAQ